jgi:hypothetical protein
MDTIRTHLVTFWIDPQVKLPENPLPCLRGLVFDVNEVFVKNTNRRFFLDENDPYRIVSDPWQRPGGPLSKGDEWRVTVCIDYDPVSGHGWPKVLEDGSAGVMMKAPALYHPLGAPNDHDDHDRDRQIHCIVHEIGHHCWVGIGEYYKLARVDDSTGVYPHIPIDCYDPNCPYWSTRKDFLEDPMLLFKPRGKFSELSAKIINGDFRLGGTAVSVELNVLLEIKNQSREPVSGARVRVFHQDHSSPDSALILEQVTGEFGWVMFRWSANESVAYSQTVRLVKVEAPGMKPAALWLSTYDLQASFFNNTAKSAFVVEMEPLDGAPAIPTEIVLKMSKPKHVTATGCVPGVTYELLARDTAPMETMWRVVAEKVAEAPLLNISDPSADLPNQAGGSVCRIYRLRSKRVATTSLLAYPAENFTCKGC